MLADEKKYIASESTFYRILKEENQLAHRGKSRPSKHNRPKECIAVQPCQVWSWDISYLPTQVAGLYFYLYMIIDIFSRKIVGFRVHLEESAEHASRLMEQACFDEKVSQNQLTLHQDNGSPMKASVLHETLKKLDVVPSFSRPSVSDDNPYSESLFKTMKYRPEFPSGKKFESLEGATEWCEWFVKWYNNEHLHSNLKFLSPSCRHSGKDKTILASRHETYISAKEKNPLRWSGRRTRNWDLPLAVSLNPNKKNNNSSIEKIKSLCIMTA
jgi:transposase InsO family protein